MDRNESHLKNDKFAAKFGVRTETDIWSIMDSIFEYLVNQEDDLFDLIKIIDMRAESVDFTKRIYEWSRAELLKEGELSDTELVDMSPDFVDAFVELINKSAKYEIIRRVDVADEESE